MAEFAVMTTYYVAQLLFVHNARRGTAADAQSPNNSPALFGGVTPR
jgi:hypothetical protein